MPSTDTHSIPYLDGTEEARDYPAADQAQAEAVDAAISAAVTGIDHGALSGKGDDDHTQYTRADGTRAFTGAQSMGGNRLTSVATPTADTDAAPRGYVTAPAINAQTGTSYTLALDDAGKAVHLTNGSAITLTVPTNATVAFPTGSLIILYQGGAGLVTVSAAGGVTIRQVDGLTTLAGQYGEATLRKVGTNEWVLSGALG